MTNEKPFKSYCYSCAKSTNCTVLAKNSSEEKNWGTGEVLFEDFTMCRCNGCDTVFIVREKYSSEDSYEDVNGMDYWPKNTTYWPNKPVQVFNNEIIENLNDDDSMRRIKSIVEEVTLAVQNGIYTLAAIGVRAIVELTYSSLKIGMKRNLDVKIEELHKINLITETEKDSLHCLRLVGNSAAHEVWKPTKDETKTLCEIAERLLLKSFIEPKKQVELSKKAKSAVERLNFSKGNVPQPN